MYSRKQNQDPNRSTMISSKPSCDKKSHNQSLQMVSQSVYQNNKKRQGQQFINQNSAILAQMRQSKLLNSKSSNNTKRQTQRAIGQRNRSRQPSQNTTQRSSYKPRFIIKDMLQQQEHQSQDHQSIEQSSQMNTIVTNSESMCEQYKRRPYESQEQESNVSGTFNNSPLGSSNENYYYRFVKKAEENGKGKGMNGKGRVRDDSFSKGNKSVVVVAGGKRDFVEDYVGKKTGKQSFVQEQDIRTIQAKALMREQEERETRVKLVNKGNLNQQRYETRIKRISQCSTENLHPNNLKRIPTQQSSQLHQQSPDQTSPQDTFYEQSSTVQYPLPKSSMAPLFQTRVRSISTANNDTNKLITQKDYKVEYLQTKKLLDVRLAYFNEAMELCKHVMGNMKEVLAQQLARKQQYGQPENGNGIEWCYERCEDMIEALEGYSSKAII